MLKLIPTLQLLIAFQCLFFVGFLIVGNRLYFLSNRVLCCLLIVLGLHMTLNLINTVYPARLGSGISIMFGFCYGPLLYTYTRSLAFKDYKLHSKIAWHTAPALIALTLTYFVKMHIFVYAFSIFASLAIYAYLSQKLLVKYRAVLRQTRSEYDAIALNWLSNLLLIQIGLLALNVGSTVLYIAEMKTGGLRAEVALFLGLLLLVNFIVYNGLLHPNLFAGISRDEEALANSITELSPSILSDRDAVELFAQIEAHMAKYQPYLSPELTVKSLGRQLLTTQRSISQAINIAGKKNFSEYVNEHRVRYAQDLLRRDTEHKISILDVMLQSGFNTKSNFNRSFKVTSNMTPIAYRQQCFETKK